MISILWCLFGAILASVLCFAVRRMSGESSKTATSPEPSTSKQEVERESAKPPATPPPLPIPPRSLTIGSNPDGQLMIGYKVGNTFEDESGSAVSLVRWPLRISRAESRHVALEILLMQGEEARRAAAEALGLTLPAEERIER